MIYLLSVNKITEGPEFHLDGAICLFHRFVIGLSFAIQFIIEFAFEMAGIP